MAGGDKCCEETRDDSDGSILWDSSVASQYDDLPDRPLMQKGSLDIVAIPAVPSPEVIDCSLLAVVRPDWERGYGNLTSEGLEDFLECLVWV